MIEGRGLAGWYEGAAGRQGRGRLSAQLQHKAVGAAHPFPYHAADGLALPVGGGHATRAQPRGGHVQSYDSIPVSTSLLGDNSDMATSTGLAQHLARKTNKQVFVSYNLQNTDSNFALLVENRIKEEMEAFPEKF